MDVWMDIWMGVWMDGYMYGWMYGWMYGYIDICMDVLMDRCVAGYMDGSLRCFAKRFPIVYPFNSSRMHFPKRAK